MEEFRPKKGKEGTRGMEQIAKENIQTLQFYRNMIIGANGIYFTGMTLEGAEYTSFEIIMWFVCATIYIASYQFFAWTGTPKISERGKVLESGVDLNMDQGLAEHVKDLIILTSGTQVLSLISNYLWFFLLLVPIRAFWMAWVNFISPWIFAPAPEEDEDPKKQKKLDRKLRRQR